MKPLIATASGVLGTVVIAAILLTQAPETDWGMTFVFGIDLFMLGVFVTLTAQQIATSNELPNLLRDMNQAAQMGNTSRVNASQMSNARYPWEA